MEIQGDVRDMQLSIEMLKLHGRWMKVAHCSFAFFSDWLGKMDVQWKVDKLSLIGLPPDVCEGVCEIGSWGPGKGIFWWWPKIGRKIVHPKTKRVGNWKLTISDWKFDRIWDIL